MLPVDNPQDIVLRDLGSMIALLVCQFASEEYPESALFVWAMMGYCNLYSGNTQNAVANFRKAIEIDPDSPGSTELLELIKKYE